MGTKEGKQMENEPERGLPKVELRPIYGWVCPMCDGRNYVDAILTDHVPQSEKEDMYREEYELEDWQELPEGWDNFEVLSSPEIVECTECSAQFSPLTDDDIEEGLDDEDDPDGEEVLV